MTNITVKKEFTFLFSTLVLQRQLEATELLTTGLHELILAHEQQSAGITKSNVGGWHSATDLWRWDGPAPAELFQRVAAAVKDYAAIERRVDAAALDLTVTAEAWANVARTGDYAKPHIHPNSNISGVYYVDAGDAPPDDSNSGVIELMDPRQRPGMFETAGTVPFDAYRIVPKTGMLLLFPAWLYHYVHPYQGTRPRVSVAFNFTIQKLQVVTAPATQGP
jgi:uncharacterized protein (TIGR02466 family)